MNLVNIFTSLLQRPAPDTNAFPATHQHLQKATKAIDAGAFEGAGKFLSRAEDTLRGARSFASEAADYTTVATLKDASGRIDAAQAALKVSSPDAELASLLAFDAMRSVPRIAPGTAVAFADW